VHWVMTEGAGDDMCTTKAQNLQLYHTQVIDPI
jgi:hypothetical protein